jgi:hypothetical protein
MWPDHCTVTKSLTSVTHTHRRDSWRLRPGQRLLQTRQVVHVPVRVAQVFGEEEALVLDLKVWIEKDRTVAKPATATLMVARC